MCNKVDLLSDDELPGQCGEWRADTAAPGAKICPVSAITGAGVDALIETIGEALGVAAPHEVVLDCADGKTRAWLYRSGAVLDEQTAEDGNLHLLLQADEQLLAQLKSSGQVELRGKGALPKISVH